MDEGDFKRIIEGALTGVRDEVAETRRHAETLAEQTRQSLKQEIAQTRQHLDASLKQEIAQTRQHLDASLKQEIAQTRQHLDASLKQEIAQTRQHTDSVTEEIKRHFDVVAEQLTGDMKLLAEGFADLSARVDRKADAEEMRQEFAEVRSMIRFSHVDLDRRLRTLEDVVAALQVRVDRIEGSLPQ